MIQVQKRVGSMAVLLAAFVLLGMANLSGSAFGYEEIRVINGGSITGKVTLRGPIPPPRAFPVVIYPFADYCKRISNGKGDILLEEFWVGPGGGMKDTVVAVEQVEKGKPFHHPDLKFVAVDCMFHPADAPKEETDIIDLDGRPHHEHPLVTILENDRPISMVNQDPIVHNIQVFQSERGNIILNVPLPISTAPMGGTLKFSAGKRISQMICGVHEFMQSWGFVVDNPYYAITKKDGAFSIDQLPPGTYRVIAWHPHLKPIEREVTVPPRGAVSLSFEFDSAEVERPIYEIQTEFRIGPRARPSDNLLNVSPFRQRPPSNTAIQAQPLHEHMMMSDPNGK
jgi:hypothetical protein